MRLLGQVEVADFVRSNPQDAEVLWAWLNEVRYRTWASSEALVADFRSAEAQQPPYVVFRLGSTPVLVETIVDYRNGVVLVTRLSVRASMRRMTR